MTADCMAAYQRCAEAPGDLTDYDIEALAKHFGNAHFAERARAEARGEQTKAPTQSKVMPADDYDDWGQLFKRYPK